MTRNNAVRLASWMFYISSSILLLSVSVNIIVDTYWDIVGRC